MLAALLLLLAGCAGNARVELASLNYRAIDPPAGPPPHFVSIDVQRCYWWTDEDGQVWVALECDRPSVVGELGHFKFQVSFALQGPPAGRARDYQVTRRELRARAKFGPSESRFESLTGIVALYREPHDRLRGSFRLLVVQDVQQLLGGWNRVSQYLMMGTFNAVPDEVHGRMIAADTEAFGWEREPAATQPSTTQPTTRPARK